ncbi:MAG: SDR family NAD(P)-dependent oxidoreductase [Pigmentiphaga sp.]
MAHGVQDKVIVITGAGRGIGRAIALYAASQGAKVVVNDLGAAPDGGGHDASPADETVAAIRSAGGEAVASTDSIADGPGAKRIIQTALDTYGDMDCVINNAGILRDKIFHKMTEDDWRTVIDVNLTGYYNVSRAAADHFKERQKGSYLHFTSPAALIGSVGQANYAAAKMGVVGLSTSIAFDMQRYNVRSNCVAPSAWSRLLAGIPVRNKEEEERNARWQRTMSAEKIAPLCVFLASDAAREITGQVFKVRGNEIFLMSQPRPIRSLHKEDGWTLEALDQRLIPAFRRSFTPLESHLEVFDWEPV